MKTKKFPSLDDVESSHRSGMRYFIDGGMLLHRIGWTIGSSIMDVCASYASFLSTYASCTIVNVFEGYHCYSTKYMVHNERGRNGEISPEFSTALTVKKVAVLSNSVNKQTLSLNI